MKYIFPFLLSFLTTGLFSQTRQLSSGTGSPLGSYSTVWNDAKYDKYNTAATADYLSKEEKDVIYILNLVRSNPALFSTTVLKKYPQVSGNDYLSGDTFYFRSLVRTLEKMEPQDALYPDKACFISAKCHAYNSGITGYVGHVRKTTDCKTKQHYFGECCDYGHNDALEIVLSLLIDEGVSSLGHRNICLGNYTKLGVSIQPHSKYGSNAVLDFYY